MRIIILVFCIASCQAVTVGDCNGHPAIANGDVHTQPEKTELKVQCALLYKLEGPEIVKCVNGNWSTLPVCLSPCKLDQKLFYSVQDDYIAHGAKKRVWCYMNGWIEVKCNNGRTLYKGCGFYDW
ncbi:complement factor H-related protein 2-like [Clarias gariepinus]